MLALPHAVFPSFVQKVFAQLIPCEEHRAVSTGCRANRPAADADLSLGFYFVLPQSSSTETQRRP